MNFQALLDTLGVAGGSLKKSSLTLNSADFPDSLSQFFRLGFQNQAFSLYQAKVNQCDESKHYVSITGTASYLNIPDREAQIDFWFDEENALQAVMTFELLGMNPGPNDWRFSKSFPDLPQTPDETLPMLFDRATGESYQQTHVALDTLNFFDARFMVASCDYTCRQTAHAVKPGINFVGKVRPEGPIAIAANAFNVTTELPVCGTIRLPIEGEQPIDLFAEHNDPISNFVFPWSIADQFDEGLPGILLGVEIDINTSLGKDVITLSGDKLMIYTPISEDWQSRETNPMFAPEQGFVGSINVPEAGIETLISIPFEPGIDQFAVIAECDGLSLDNLSAGGMDFLTQRLPGPLQGVSKALGKLEVSALSVLVDYSDGFSVDDIQIEVGMPDLNLVIWKDKFELDAIACTFRFKNPFSTTKARQTSAKLTATMEIGNVLCQVSADSQDDFAFYAQMAAGERIPLGKILKQYAPEIKAPAALTISSLKLSVIPGESYSFGMVMAGDEETSGFKVPVGITTLDVQNVSMFAKYDQGKGFSGSVSGKTYIGDNLLRVNYQTPGNILIYSHIPETSLGNILDTFTGGALDLPKGFDLDLKNNSIQLRKATSDYTLVMATEVDKVGTFALQVGKQRGQMGAAFGLALKEPKLSSLPGLKSLKVIDDAVTLNQLTLLVSSFDSPSFSFPELSAFSNPAINSSSIPMPSGGGVVKGFNGHASLSLDTKELKLLRDILGLDPTLDITLQVGLTPSDVTRLFASLSVDLLGKYPLAGQFGFMLENGKVSLFLAGDLQVKIQKQKVNFNMAMSLLPSGVFFAGSAVGTIPFDNVKLSNLGLAIGVNFGGIPSLGIAAQIDSKAFSSSIAVILDSTDPSKSVLAGSISPISLAVLTKEFAKVSAIPKDVSNVFKTIKLKSVRSFEVDASAVSSLDNKDHAAVSSAFADVGATISGSEDLLLIVVRKKGKIWSLTDMAEGMRHYTVTLKDKKLTVAITPQVYIAPTGARMGKLTFTQGYFLSGCLSIAGESLAVQVEVSNKKGIAATAYMKKPLQIVNKHFFRLSDVSNKKGPLMSLSSFKQPKHEIPELRNPHFALNGKLCLLGQETTAFANITSKGIDLLVESDTTVTLQESFIEARYDFDWKIAGSVGSPTNMFLEGAINFLLEGKFILAKLLGVNADLGKLKVNTQVMTDAEIGYQDNKAYVTLDGRFAFAGESFNFDLEADTTNAQIEKLGKLVLNEIKSAAMNFYDTAEEWLNALDDGLVEIGKAAGTVGKALKNGFKQTDKAATKLLKDAGRTADQVGNELKHGFNSSADAASKLLKGVGYEAKDIGGVLKKSYKQTANQATKLLKEAGHGADDLAKMLKGAYGSSNSAIAKSLKAVGHSPNQIAKSMKNALKATPNSIAKDLKSAGINVDDVGKALKSLGHSDEAISKALKGAGFAVKDVGKFLKHTLKIDSETGAKLLKSAGFSSTDIAKALRANDLWDKGHKALAKTLKKAGFGKSTAKSAMKAAGVAKKKIEDAFSWLKW
ncbi:MAG: hypothetical protein OXE99_12115 [Cellvibrionales bacterium]|nr:hypothetical protein [Cellvibrionales bacterium]